MIIGVPNLCRRRKTFYGAKPGIDARMGSDENRFFPGKRSVDIAVQMNQVRFEVGGRAQQPIACEPNVLPGIVHPFEFKIALIKPHIWKLGNLMKLLGSQRARSEEHTSELQS